MLRGFKLRFASQLRVQRCKRASFLYPLFLSLGEEGILLTVCLQLRAKRSRASPSFASCYALATAEGRPSPKPSSTPLHVRSCCTACRSRFGAYALHIFLIYSRRKFANLKTQRRFASAKLCRHLSRRRRWGIKGGGDFVIQAPSPLTKKQDNCRQSFLFLRNLTHSVKFENQI